MGKAYLKIEFSGFWRCGSGGSGGGDVDTAALRDKHDVPYVPAKQYKGILREAAQYLADEKAEGWTQEKLEVLLGTAAKDGESKAGCLDFRDAKLSSEIYEEIANHKEFLPTLFVHLASTAVKHKSGVARTDSLRSVEAVVPLIVVADISWSPHERLLVGTNEEKDLISKLENEWIDLLDAAAALSLSVGGQRSDGLGRAVFTVHPYSQEVAA